MISRSVLLHQSTENHGPDALRLTRRVDATDRLLRLVNSGDKWQSHLPKCLPIELRQQAVPHGLGGHAGLVGHKNRSSLPFFCRQGSRVIACYG